MSKADAFVDITDVVCPITFVKTKIAMEELGAGQTLEIHLNGGEPIQNVPRSLEDDGHTVLDMRAADDGTFYLLVKKGED